MQSFDVIIIGAGVIGSAIARELSRYRLKIAVMEKEADVSFGTSKANSGIIHSGFHSHPGTLKARLEVEGNCMFDSLSEELEFPFERKGELMVAFDDEELQTLRKYYGRGLDNGVQGMELLDRKRTLEMEPNLNPEIAGSLYAPSAGTIGPYEYCFALVENARLNGVEFFLESRVSSIRRSDNGKLQIGTGEGLVVESDFVLNAAGLHSDEIAELAGAGTFKILPRKGEEYLLDRRVGGLVKRVIFPVPSENTKGMLVIPTVDGPVMVGPTAVNTDDRTDFGTTKEGLEKVFMHARKMVPSIRKSDIITSFAGIRPAATGNDFIIGATNVKGFINVAGIQSPGLTASPAIAVMVSEILHGQGLVLEPRSDYKPRRKNIPFRVRKLVEDRDYGKLAEIIAGDKAYSRLVCRCENVTEAEIVAAVRNGHHTLDGIKFSARAGSGRCQGGFCACRVMEIIARETGMPVGKITKKGRGSEILADKLGKLETK